jgi:hypothetical protein
MMRNEIMIIVFFCGFLAGLVTFHIFSWTFNWASRRNARRVLFDFQDRFPDRCPICSYHSYGITHGHLDPEEPVPPHRCLENKEKPHV